MVIFHACTETTHTDPTFPYLEVKVESTIRTPTFVAISSGVLLPRVAENPTFLILKALAYTTGLGNHLPVMCYHGIKNMGILTQN